MIQIEPPMSKTLNLYRRGNVLYFRLSVPDRFRAILRVSEFTQSLHIQNRKDAIPAAYKLAGEAKTFFNYIDSFMSDKELTDDPTGDLIKLINQKLVEANESGNLFDPRKKRGLLQELLDSHRIKTKQLEEIESLREKVWTLELKQKEESEQAELKTKAALYDMMSSANINVLNNASQSQQEPIIAKVAISNAPLLSVCL
jgi:hypothetical protein